MSKYYKVYLIDDSKNRIEDCTTIEQNYAICKETVLGFKEIITEKAICPRAEKPLPILTFGSIPNTLYKYNNQRSEYIQENYSEAIMIGMTSQAVVDWLTSMDEKTLKEYVANINRLEEEAIKKYYSEQSSKSKKMQEREANKIIKRKLREIQQK